MNEPQSLWEARLFATRLGLIGMAAISGGIVSYLSYVALSSLLLLTVPAVAVGLRHRWTSADAEKQP